MTTSLRTDSNNLAGAVSFKGVDNVKLTTAGPELLGVPKAATPAAGTNTTQVATTAFVQAAVQAAAGVVAGNITPGAATATGSPGTSLAYSREDHRHVVQDAASTPFTPIGGVSSSNVQNAIGELDAEKLSLTGGTLSGSLTVSATSGAVTVVTSGTRVELGGVGGCIEVVASVPFIDLKNTSGEDYDWRLTSDGTSFSIVNALGKRATTKSDGTVENYGTLGRSGVSGAWQTNVHNFYWSSNALQMWIDSTNVGTIALTSDERVKKDIAPITSPFSTKNNFMLLQPVTYKFDNVGVFKDDGITRYGFVAQDVQQLFPSAVNGDAGDPYSTLCLDPLQLVAILTVSLQDAIRRIESLEAYALAHP